LNLNSSCSRSLVWTVVPFFPVFSSSNQFSLYLRFSTYANFFFWLLHLCVCESNRLKLVDVLRPLLKSIFFDQFQFRFPIDLFSLSLYLCVCVQSIFSFFHSKWKNLNRILKFGQLFFLQHFFFDSDSQFVSYSTKFIESIFKLPQHSVHLS